MKFSTLKINVNTYHSDASKNEFLSYDFSDNSKLIKAPEYCVKNIMDFARSYKVADSKETGKIEMIMN